MSNELRMSKPSSLQLFHLSSKKGGFHIQIMEFFGESLPSQMYKYHIWKKFHVEGADTALWFIRNVVRIEMSKKVHQAFLPKKLDKYLDVNIRLLELL